MNKKSASLVAKNIVASFEKHQPEILTGLGITGMLSAIVLAVRATPKAYRMLNDRKEELETDKLAVPETLKVTWRCYIPCALASIGGAACIIGANSVHLRRNAAIATAYTLSESAFKEYKSKVIETIGERKEETVRDSVAKNKLTQKPIAQNEVIITNKGDTLCFDALSGRYFKSDIERIRKTVNELNRVMINEMSVSLNDFYYELGLSAVPIGEELGWNVNRGLIEVSFSSQLADDGTPCLVMGYDVAPKYDYTRF